MKTSLSSSLAFWVLLLPSMILLPQRSKGAYIFGYLLHNPIPDLESSNSLALSDRMLSDEAVIPETSTTSSISSTTSSPKALKEPKKDKVRRKLRRTKKKPSMDDDHHLPAKDLT